MTRALPQGPRALYLESGEGCKNSLPSPFAPSAGGRVPPRAASAAYGGRYQRSSITAAPAPPASPNSATLPPGRSIPCSTAPTSCRGMVAAATSPLWAKVGITWSGRIPTRRQMVSTKGIEACWTQARSSRSVSVRCSFSHCFACSSSPRNVGVRGFPDVSADRGEQRQVEVAGRRTGLGEDPPGRAGASPAGRACRSAPRPAGWSPGDGGPARRSRPRRNPPAGYRRC